MKIGILLNDLMLSQRSFYAVKELSKCLDNVDDSPVIFYLNMSSKVTDIHFAMMNVYNLTHFSGVCLATDLETADILRKSNNRMDRYFYIWDLEWLRSTFNYENVLEVMTDPKLKLIARSEDHKRVIENYTNKEVVGIVEDFNIDQLKGLIDEGYK